MQFINETCFYAAMPTFRLCQPWYYSNSYNSHIREKYKISNYLTKVPIQLRS